MERAELLACRDVSLGYEGQRVLTHLNLSVREGDYLCIVGENGSGKSTLLRGLLGLLPPQSGEIWRSEEIRRGAVGLSGHRAGGGALRLPEPAGDPVFLLRRPEVRGPDAHGQAGNFGAEG